MTRLTTRTVFIRRTDLQADDQAVFRDEKEKIGRGIQIFGDLCTEFKVKREDVVSHIFFFNRNINVSQSDTEIDHCELGSYD